MYVQRYFSIHECDGRYGPIRVAGNHRFYYFCFSCQTWVVAQKFGPTKIHTFARAQ